MEGVKFECDDILTSDLSQTGILWLNDATWPDNVTRDVFAAAAAQLPAGSVVVSYKSSSDSVALMHNDDRS